MAVVVIFSGTFCHGDEVAGAVAEAASAQRLSDDDVLAAAARTAKTTPERLARVVRGPAPFLNRLTHERERGRAHLRAAMAEVVQRDGVVFHGFAGHLVPSRITHVLRVCLIANLAYRVEEAERTRAIPEREARRLIQAEDRERAHWTQELCRADPYDAALYDAVLAMQSTTQAEAGERIRDLAGRPELVLTAESAGAAADFALAAQVEVALIDKAWDIEVTAEDCEVTVAVNRYTARFEALRGRLESLAAGVPGVKGVKCIPGPRFVPPSLLVSPEDLEVPPKILLVDDEREFVHTLSERLQARSMEPAVVYDGQEALDFVASDEPEVMVLDLKMPGIDGMEVLRRVKRSNPNVEVIILTGHGSDREEEEARELGAFAYLRKPVDVEHLASMLRKAHRRSTQGGGGHSSESEG